MRSLLAFIPALFRTCTAWSLAWVAVDMIFAMAQIGMPAQDESNAPETYEVSGGKLAEIEIISQRGIGRALLKPSSNGWPKELLIHLRLKGLESFTLITPAGRAETSVSSADGSVRLTTWSPVAEPVRETKELEPDDPRCLRVEPLKGIAGDDSLPPGFRVTIPATLLDKDFESLEIRWIDFFR